MPPLAKLNQLSLAFCQSHRSIKIVDGVDLTIQAGEMIALLGESGCGKSAMAMGIMRLLPAQARYGMKSAIYLEEMELLSLPEYLMRQVRGYRIGMVFQEPMTALNPVLTIRTQLAEAFLTHKKLSRQDLETQLINALTEVEMPEPLTKLAQYPHQLSGGQKQRVVLAMALAAHPDLLIADEPTTALDVTIQAQILELLKRLQQQRKMSVLLITHDLGVVKTVANRVCVMYAGEIVSLSPIDTFFESVNHPYVQQLLQSAPSFEKRNQYLDAIAGQVPTPGSWPTGCRFHPRCEYVFDRCTHEKPQLLKRKKGATRCHLFENPLDPTLILERPNSSPKTEPVIQLHEPEVLLEAKHLEVAFKIKKNGLYGQSSILKAVNNVSFNLARGKTLAIVGESGSGKTTLSRALLQLSPLTQGSLLFKHQELRHMSRAQLKNFRKSVQMVFQDPYTSLNPRMTVGEILAEGMEVQGMSTKTIQEKQKQLLEQVYLSHSSINRYPHEFSGGQRQRISIARALSTDPEILICDEPTSALDVSVQAQILNLFKELQLLRGLAYVFITHNMAVVSYIAHDVLVMKAGEVVESGSVEEVLFKPKAPYTKQLLGSVLTM